MPRCEHGGSDLWSMHYQLDHGGCKYVCSVIKILDSLSTTAQTNYSHTHAQICVQAYAQAHGVQYLIPNEHQDILSISLTQLSQYGINKIITRHRMSSCWSL